MVENKIKAKTNKSTIYYCLECGNASTVDYKCCELCGCGEWAKENKAGDKND